MTTPGEPELLPVIAVDGAFNFRDLGGVSTTDGRLVLPRRVYRSATLDGVSPAGLTTLAELGIHTVIDLRSEAEVAGDGRFPHEGTGIEWFHLASAVGPPSGEDPRMAAVFAAEDPMALIFPLLVTRAGSMFGTALRLIAEGGRTPLVFHCTSGKDRTGLLAALLHLILGVDLPIVLADFERSTLALAEIRAQMAARYHLASVMSAEQLDRMAGADRAWVLHALEAIGGLAGLEPWLDSIGVDAAVRHALRTTLLAP